MTSGADPSLLQRLAETQEAVKSESAQISEDLRATEAELAEEARLAREANDQFCRELDEQVEQRRAGQAEDSAKHRWPGQAQTLAEEHTFGFEEDRTVAQWRMEQDTPAGSTPPQHRHRAAAEEFDEDDFSNNSWLGY